MDDARLLPAKHRLTVRAFEQMGEAGIVAPDERIELIDGDLIDMAPIGLLHAATVTSLTEAIFIACAGRAIVSTQNPVLLDGSNLPQPDLAVLRRREDFYRDARPGPADILLLVEVADTSLRFDRTVKLPLYARAGIAEFWLVDLGRRIVEVHRKPEGETYTDTTTHRPGDSIPLLAAPGIVVQLGPIFG